jgi:FlaA1/EpsC-like NDP-sugar epimerase
MRNRRHIDVWVERTCNMAAIVLSVTGAFLLRFDFSLPATVIPILKQAVLIAILLKLPIFDWVGFYRGCADSVSIPDLCLVFLGNLAGSVLFAAVSMFWIGPALPRSVLVIDAVLCLWVPRWCDFRPNP